MNPILPSPDAPWDRPNQGPVTQIITISGTAISLTVPLTILDSDPADDGEPIDVNLPDGTYVSQHKRIFIPYNRIGQTSADWKILGTFTTGSYVLMGLAYGTSALFEWDGDGWQWLGGNCTLIPV